MEKHIEIFCKQNPQTTLACPNCKKKFKAKTKEFLQKKYEYKCQCKYCKSNITFDTKDFYKSLETLKKFV